MSHFANELVQRVRSARRVTVLTGAGVSAESGIPTFRDAQTGLWARYDPQELATAAAFERNPRLVWEWYASRRQKVAACHPNPAHLALAHWQQHDPCLTLITQNVDGLHQRAGSQGVIALHGDITRVTCYDHHHPAATWQDGPEVPRCPQCGSLLRPDVVWFGEGLPPLALRQALEAAESADLFLAIGTSALVWPAAGLPELALSRGACCIEINPASTPLTPHVQAALRGPAGVVLPALLAAAFPEEPRFAITQGESP